MPQFLFHQPDALAGAASAFTSDLAALAAALQANDVAAAFEVGRAVHGTQSILRPGSAMTRNTAEGNAEMKTS